jgi:phospholipid/cholesterol/gamma-HCH transport system substrate-binding protein
MTRRLTMSARRRGTLLAGLALVLVLVGGCSVPSLRSLPAPQAVSGPTYRLTADFEDALNLPIGAKVKVNGAVIGQVTQIRTSDFRAHITLRIAKDQRLPVGTKAQIRFTTPLGELYVAMYPPAKGSRFLEDGAHLSAAETTAAPTIEDAFAALSTLINGGGLDQIGILVTELNKSLHGNERPVRDLLHRLDALVTDFNVHRSDFDKALAGLNALATELAAGDNVIDQALTTFTPALRLLNSETGQLNALLDHVSALGRVTERALHRGTSALLDDLDHARPVLASLAGVRNRLAPTMRGLVAFGKVLTGNAPGDYLNAVATVTLDFTGSAVLPSTTGSTNAATDSQDAIKVLLGGGSP